MRSAAFLLLLIVGCGGGELARTFRDDPAATLASKADFSPDRMAGSWYEVARFPDGGCGGGTLQASPQASGALEIVEACGGVTRIGRAEPTGPGRLQTDLAGLRDETWVLWTDTGYRTAVLVAPDGSGGRVLNRNPTIPADRRNAVLEVLDFNGFNASELVFSPAG